MSASKLLAAKDVASMLRIAENTVWKKLRRDQSFPRPIKLSTKCTRWRLAEIEAWLASKQTEAAA